MCKQRVLFDLSGPLSPGTFVTKRLQDNLQSACLNFMHGKKNSLWRISVKFSLPRQNDQRQTRRKTKQHNFKDGVGTFRRIFKFLPDINTPQRSDYRSSLS